MIDETLQAFFKKSACIDKRGFHSYYLVEKNNQYEIQDDEVAVGRTLSIQYNDENEVKLSLYSDGLPLVDVQRIPISKVTIIKDKDEESIQFVLERMPSRMLKVNVKPHFSIQFTMYWEVCEDCE
ncbi:DUF3979 family protein [Ectobacillus sp. sgz5001026]|uniref:DUF3979 family protein n=1 Tax=Ectobacillus sp. sgz5001026 TaxID=3242473 RepID=UPI0036D2B952